MAKPFINSGASRHAPETRSIAGNTSCNQPIVGIHYSLISMIRAWEADVDYMVAA